jgi:KduI/IolB family
MNRTNRLQALLGDHRLMTATCAEARWLDHGRLWRPTDPDQLVTGDHETAVLLLGGTFDLVGGGTAWPARGARKDPFGGRPMAVFLPPRTTFQVSRGSGEILLIAARQPAVRDEPTGRAMLASKPLLPMAGSGKSFDPNIGEWRPAETFPTAPESLPPRRFERIPVGANTVERVFAPDYKAATLSLDEVVLAAGTTLALADLPGRPAAAEALLFVRSEGAALVDGLPLAASDGDRVLRLDRAELERCRVQAVTGRTYLAIAYAGKGA